MHNIADGKLEIVNLVRAEAVTLPKSRRECRRRRWDTFCFVLSGSCVYHMADGTTISLQPGDVQYLPLEAKYTMEIFDEGFSYYICDFACTSPPPRQHFVFSAKAPQKYETLFRKLILHFALGENVDIPTCYAILYQIYAQIVNDLHPVYLSGNTRQKVEDAKVYILTHLADPALQVSEIAENVQISEVHLRRLFQQTYGTSPGKYITNARIAKAKSMLGLAEMQIRDIALQTGFSSTAYFCSAFKAATGMTPAHYRKLSSTGNAF